MLAIYYWLVYHSFHPTLYVLFLITFTNTSTERLGLIRKFKRGVKDKGIGHWGNGVEEENGEEPE